MTSFEPLPHSYPFRLADRSLERAGMERGSVRTVLSANGRIPRDGPLSAAYLGEMMAQAALLLAGTDEDLGRTGFLAGLSGVDVTRPPGAGEALTVEVRVAGRMGAVVKFEASVVDAEGLVVARGGVTVREGRPA